jgi:hypothetical protein
MRPLGRNRLVNLRVYETSKASRFEQDAPDREITEAIGHCHGCVLLGAVSHEERRQCRRAGPPLGSGESRKAAERGRVRRWRGGPPYRSLTVVAQGLESVLHSRRGSIAHPRPDHSPSRSELRVVSKQLRVLFFRPRGRLQRRAEIVAPALTELARAEPGHAIGDLRPR